MVANALNKLNVITMKIVIDIPDNKAAFGIEVLKNLHFIKKTQPLSNSASQLWDELNQAAKEVKLHKEGKLKLKTAAELLNEL